MTNAVQSQKTGLPDGFAVEVQEGIAFNDATIESFVDEVRAAYPSAVGAFIAFEPHEGPDYSGIVSVYPIESPEHLCAPNTPCS